MFVKLIEIRLLEVNPSYQYEYVPVPGTCFFLPVRAALVEQRLFDAQLLKYRHVLQSEHSQDTLHPMRDDDKQRKQVVAPTHASLGGGFKKYQNASRTSRNPISLQTLEGWNTGTLKLWNLELLRGAGANIIRTRARPIPCASKTNIVMEGMLQASRTQRPSVRGGALNISKRLQNQKKPSWNTRKSAHIRLTAGSRQCCCCCSNIQCVWFGRRDGRSGLAKLPGKLAGGPGGGMGKVGVADRVAVRDMYTPLSGNVGPFKYSY